MTEREVVVCLLCRPRAMKILGVRRAGGEEVGAPAVEPPKNSTWRSSAPAGTTEHMMSAAVTRRERAAGAL